MRKINTADVCKCARIIKTTGMRDKLMELFEKGKEINATDIDSPVVQEFGVSVIFEIIETLAEREAENQIYDLLGGILEKNADEIANQGFLQTVEDVKTIAKENDLKGFFIRASQLMR